MNQRSNVLLPLVISFVVFAAAVVLAWLFWKNSNIDFIVLLGANVLFFLVSVMAFRMQYAAMQKSNPNVFIRKVMSTMLLKMGIALAAVMAYVLISGKNFNKPSVYISMLIYLVYLVVEVGAVMKLNKRKNA